MSKDVSQVPSAVVRAHLQSILTSRLFAEARHQREFLRWVVDKALAGRQHEITGANFRVDLQSRGTERISETAVRTAAREVRRKLDNYYKAAEGRSTPVRIVIPERGSYVPAFLKNDDQTTPFEPPNLDTSTPDRMRLSLMAIFGLAGMAAENEQWKELVRITEAVSNEIGNESTLPLPYFKLLTALRVQRLGALMREQKIDASALRTTKLLDLDRLAKSGTECQALANQSCCIGILVCEIAKDDAAVVRFTDSLLEQGRLAGAGRDTVLRQTIGIARELNKVGLYDGAKRLLTRAIGLISTSSLQNEIYAEILYLLQWNARDLGQLEESLELHRRIRREYDASPASPSALWCVAWSATEAIRSLTSLKRYSEAQELLNWQLDRFSSGSAEHIRKAVAWAVAEQSKPLFASGYYDEALRICESSITALHALNGDGLVDFPVAWAYAQKALCLRRMGSFDACLSACDEMIGRYLHHPDDDVQTEVAWVMLERATCLRRAKRLRASVLAARQIQEHFADSRSLGIVKQRIHAVHAEGDALLCEAKMQISNGVTEDGRDKLQEAIQLFEKAAAQDPTSPWHLACSSYAHFLRGDIDQAQSEFTKALATGPFEWQGGEHDEWSEESMFPVPQDGAFVALRLRWTKEIEKQTTKRSARKRL